MKEQNDLLVKEVNFHLEEFEVIRRYAILPHPEGQKAYYTEKYAGLIETLYQNSQA